MPSKLPIRFRTPSNVVGFADLDDSLLPLLSSVPWYLSDTRNPRPPRTVIRIRGSGKPKFLLLNRVVWVLGALSSPQERELLWKSQSLLWKMIESTPPVKHLDGNPWNCVLSNLYLLTSTVRSRVVSLTPEPSAFPSPSSALLTPSQEENPYWKPKNLSPQERRVVEENLQNLTESLGTKPPSIIIPVSDSTPDVSALDLLTGDNNDNH